MAQQIPQNVDARYSTINSVRRDQYIYYMVGHLESGGSSSQTPAPLSFNEAPTGLLSCHFTGREDELDFIGNTFQVAHGNAPPRCVVYGMPGLGKTQLVLQFAELSYNRQRYSLIFWISSATIEKLNQGFANLLNLVGHPDRDHSDQPTRLMAARRWLEEADSISWLLILDNVNKDTVNFLREHLPRRNSKGNLLFTTRTRSVADALTTARGQHHQSCELRAPELNDAVSLFLKETGADMSPMLSSRDKAEDIVKCVGCLPLAIAHAASFVKQSRQTLNELLELYKSDHKYQVISWENDLSCYQEKSVAATFSIQLEELERQSPHLANLLKVLSFFDPESIPLPMLVEGADDLFNLQSAPDTGSSEGVSRASRPLQFLLHKLRMNWRGKRNHMIRPAESQDKKYDTSTVSPNLELLTTLIRSPVLLHQAIQQLQNLSLVSYASNSNTSALRIHDLIHATIQESARRQKTQNMWFQVAVALACGTFRHVEDPFSYRCWAQCEVLVPHIQSLSIWDDKYAIHDSGLLYPMIGIANYLKSKGRYREAGVLYQRVLTGMEKLVGSDDPIHLWVMANLAIAFEFQGKYSEAETLYVCIRERAERRLGPEHPETVLALLDLSIVYQLQGRYNEAEVLGTQALAMNEKLLGLVHPHTLLTLANLAMICHSQGRYSEAEALNGRVLKGRQQQLGSEHPDTLSTVSNLAIVYQSQGRYNEARELHLWALSKRENMFGAEHPSTLWTVSNLGFAYHLLGQYDEAETMLDRALEGRKKLLGVNHLDTLDTMDNLAIVYESIGRYSEAEALGRRVLEERHKQLGPDHPDTLLTVASLAIANISQGRYSEAESLCKRGLTGHERLLGPEHPTTLLTVASLANVYRSQGRYSEAESLCKRALTGLEKRLGPVHPDTLMVVHDFAIVYQLQERYSEAEELHERALSGKEKVLGLGHPVTLGTMKKLADFYNTQGRHEEEMHLRGRFALVTK